MSDPKTPGMAGPGSDSGPGRTDSTIGRVQEEVSEAARGIKEEAAAAFEEVKAQGASVVETAQQRFGEIAEEQKAAGIRQAEGLARAIHRAADQLDETAPWMARYVHEAANSVDDMVQSLRDRRPRELLHSLEGFARRQPVAFFGAAALAGFAVARFARSGAPQGRRLASGRARQGMPGPAGRQAAPAMPGGAGVRSGDPARRSGPAAPGWVAGEAGTARPATGPAASLGGAAARGQGGITPPHPGRPE